MELTYENMLAHAKEYWAALPSIEGPQDENRIREFYAPDFKVRRRDVPVLIQNREEYVEHLCGHADVYRAHVSYEPYPLGIIIDERKKMIHMLIMEEFKHTVTGEYVKPKAFMSVRWEMCLHENKVKQRREIIVTISGPLSEDFRD